MKSKTLFEVEIGAEPVKVIEADGEYMEGLVVGDNEMGFYGYSVSFPEYTSYVNSDLQDRAKASTILHELLHNVSEIYGLGLNEAKVRVLEQSLVQILRNKKLSNYLFTYI